MWVECLLANSANASSLPDCALATKTFSGVPIPHRDSFLSTPLPRPGDSREGLLSALKVVIRKKAKQGGPLSFEIENTETGRPRNQVDPGILQQGFPLIRRVTAWNERARSTSISSLVLSHRSFRQMASTLQEGRQPSVA